MSGLWKELRYIFIINISHIKKKKKVKETTDGVRKIKMPK